MKGPKTCTWWDDALRQYDPENHSRGARHTAVRESEKARWTDRTRAQESSARALVEQRPHESYFHIQFNALKDLQTITPIVPSPPVLVDCPTQLIFTWIFICWVGGGYSIQGGAKCLSPYFTQEWERFCRIYMSTDWRRVRNQKLIHRWKTYKKKTFLKSF